MKQDTKRFCYPKIHIILLLVLSAQAPEVNYDKSSRKMNRIDLQTGPAAASMRFNVLDYAVRDFLQKVTDISCESNLTLIPNPGTPELHDRIFISKWFAAEHGPVIFVTNIRGPEKFDLFVYRQKGGEVNNDIKLIEGRISNELLYIAGVHLE